MSSIQKFNSPLQWACFNTIEHIRLDHMGYLHMSIFIHIYIWNLVFTQIASILITWNSPFWDLFTSRVSKSIESKLPEKRSLKRTCAHASNELLCFGKGMLMLFYICSFYYQFDCFFFFFLVCCIIFLLTCGSFWQVWKWMIHYWP